VVGLFFEILVKSMSYGLTLKKNISETKAS